MSGVRGVVRRPQESGNSNRGSTAHPTPPEIPPRLRRALSGKPESSTALRMTRAATQKLSHAPHESRHFFVRTFLPRGAILFSVKVLRGCRGDFFKSPPCIPRLFQQPPTATGGQCPRTRLADCFVQTLSPMVLCGYCPKISHGDSQGLIAARRAGEDFGRSHGAGGHPNNGRTARP